MHFNLFLATGPFLYPLKTSENQRFSNIFRGFRKRPVICNGLSISVANISRFLVSIETELLCSRSSSKNKVLPPYIRRMYLSWKWFISLWQGAKTKVWVKNEFISIFFSDKLVRYDSHVKALTLRLALTALHHLDVH